jgi:hypothetical protein
LSRRLIASWALTAKDAGASRLSNSSNRARKRGRRRAGVLLLGPDMGSSQEMDTANGCDWAARSISYQLRGRMQADRLLN